jgi:hypothetical protein
VRRRVPGALVVGVIVVAAVAADVVLQQIVPARDAVTVEHEWAAASSGPVWVVVDPPDDRDRTVTFRWGPWRQRTVVADGETVAFGLTKSATARGESVAVSVTVEPAAAVSFGVGPAPAGLPEVDLDGGWDRTGPFP